MNDTRVGYMNDMRVGYMNEMSGGYDKHRLQYLRSEIPDDIFSFPLWKNSRTNSQLALECVNVNKAKL